LLGWGFFFLSLLGPTAVSRPRFGPTYRFAGYEDVVDLVLIIAKLTGEIVQVGEGGDTGEKGSSTEES
jgi:hypothetical protein